MMTIAAAIAATSVHSQSHVFDWMREREKEIESKRDVNYRRKKERESGDRREFGEERESVV